MSKKKKTPNTMSEQKTLPILAQNGKGQGKAALQHKKNVVRAKKWVDEHEM